MNRIITKDSIECWYRIGATVSVDGHHVTGPLWNGHHMTVTHDVYEYQNLIDASVPAPVAPKSSRRSRK